MCASESRKGLTVWLLLLGLTSSLGAAAQDRASREQEMLRRLRLQTQELQQQLSQQRAAEQDKLRKAGEEQAASKALAETTQREAQRLRAALAAQTGAAGTLQKTLDEVRAELEALKQRRDALAADLGQREASLAALQKQQAQLNADLVQRRDALAQLQARHATQAAGLQRCIASNQALHQLGNELLDLYANKGFQQVLAQREPLVQTRRVQLENLLQDYEAKLDQQALPATVTGQQGIAAGSGPSPR